MSRIRRRLLPASILGAMLCVLTGFAFAESWPTTEWVPVCSTLGQRDCDLDDYGVEVFLNQLREASTRFEALGYRSLDFELKVTVYHEYIEVNGMGGWGNDHGPSNEAIDSPIAFPARLVYPAWGMSRVGGDQYCKLELPLDDRGEQGGILVLYSNDILAPGEYAIAELPVDENLHPSSARENLRDYPGIAIAWFHLHIVAESVIRNYDGRGGVLRIDSITPHWITGSALIQLEVNQFMEDDRSGYAGAPQAQPRYVELAVDFSASNKSYLGPLKPGVEFCTGA